MSVECLTNDKLAFYRHISMDEFFENWFDRIVWYIKRQYTTTAEWRKMDGITVLCLFRNQNEFQTILCGRQDDCLCQNLPSIHWLRVLSDVTTHSHLEPICVCDFPSDESRSRVLKLNQSNNVQ